MEFLVTGGAGFIGSNTVRRLAGLGKSVRVLDNFSTGRRENIRDVQDKAEIIEGDVRDPAVVRDAVRGVRFVFHMAAIPSVERSVRDPVATSEVNVQGTVNLLAAARDHGVERFVYASSSSVYGNSAELPKREDMIPCPMSPYAVQKFAGEHFCRVFHEIFGMRAYMLRYFNVFGPGQDPGSEYAAVIPLFVTALLSEGRRPVIHGDGRQTRDFTYIDDVVEANLRCCDAPPDAAGQAFNIARGGRSSVNQLFEVIAGITGRRGAEALHAAPRNGEVRDSQADVSKARRVLGWSPAVSLDEGLTRTVEWFRSTHASPNSPGKR